MSNPFGVMPPSRGVTVPFRPKSGNREQFMALFREGMGLVEETANYLDGEGRREAKLLKPFVSLAYATESMRLTTRLTQLATWLLTRRAELNGEEPAPGMRDTNPALLLPIIRTGTSKGYEELPARLRSLIDASCRLHEKIYRAEAAQTGQPAFAAPTTRANPVANQVAQIAAAFSRN